MDQKKAKVRVIVCLFLVLSAAGLIALGINERQQFASLQEHGQSTKALVTGHHEEKRKHKKHMRTYHCLDFKFQTQTGNEVVEKRCEFEESILAQHPVNSSFDIFYDSNDPTNYVFGTSATEEQPSIFLFIVAGMEIVLAAILWKFLKG